QAGAGGRQMRGEARELLGPIRRLHERVRDAVVEACERDAAGEMAAVDRDVEGDTIYAVDRVSEELLVEFFEREVAPHAPLVLVAEGLEGGQVVLPHGALEVDAVWRVVVDPIDGTRGLMYQKRSGWVLTGVAPNRGAGTSLATTNTASHPANSTHGDRHHPRPLRRRPMSEPGPGAPRRW
ncbi:MAG TPA: hypothetical protein VEA69_14695, partial [Tepidisphaeraceae bacterium]|nr:hypothetical protein [Tepidisphaeraceae bacterium]